MLRSLRQEAEGKAPTIHLCAHWKTFPPPGSPSVLNGETPDEVRAKGLITEDERQRLQVWQRMCGLLVMREDKCLTCPHIRRVLIKQNQAYLILPDGRKILLVEKAVFEAGSKNRSHLVVALRPPGSVGASQPAGWVKKANRGE